jgi:hypothetical protein
VLDVVVELDAASRAEVHGVHPSTKMRRSSM